MRKIIDVREVEDGRPVGDPVLFEVEQTDAGKRIAKAAIHPDAFISLCGTYRYTLLRRWDYSKKSLVVIGLNPSTADAKTDDPTIRRCMRFARDWDYGALMMVNLFALRATDPKAMMGAVKCPIGPLNDSVLQKFAGSPNVGKVLAAWGNDGNFGNRDAWVRDLVTKVAPLYVLGFTKKGMPRHPLYMPKETQPVLWIPKQDGS